MTTEKRKVERTYAIVVQDWEESERGWGVRPDGHSLHLSVDDSVKFINNYWVENHKRHGGGVPDEYSRPSGSPKLMDVNEKTYKMLVALRKKGNHGCFQYNLADVEPLSKIQARAAEAKAKSLAIEEKRQHKETVKAMALAKLTEEEKEVLGLNKPKDLPRDVMRGWRSV